MEATPTKSRELQAGEAINTAGTQIFRSEALHYYTGGRRNQGDLLRLSPAWTRWSYWLLVAVFLAGLVGAAVGTVDRYVSGPVVVMAESGAAGNPAPILIALLPAYTRPQLQPGLPVRLTLTGYPQAYQRLTIDSIADQILSPAAVRERLGAELADLVPVTAPVVLVQMRAPSATFQVEGRALAYYTGMQGTATVRVDTERLLFLLAPGLRTIFGNGS